MRKLLLLCAIPLFALALPACDSPEDEAELQALDIEDDAEVQAAGDLKAAEDVQGSTASGLEVDAITNAPHPVAALPNQLCRTNSPAILFKSPEWGFYVPQGSLVRILDYSGPSHYFARYDGKTGLLERSRVIQGSCYYQ